MCVYAYNGPCQPAGGKRGSRLVDLELGLVYGQQVRRAIFQHAPLWLRDKITASEGGVSGSSALIGSHFGGGGGGASGRLLSVAVPRSSNVVKGSSGLGAAAGVIATAGSGYQALRNGPRSISNGSLNKLLQ
jgi:hypothetical protein